MKKVLLSIAALAFLGLNAQTGYYQEPIAGSGNPGGKNADLEYPPGGGLAAGWSTLLSGPSVGTWSANQNIGFNFKFNDETVTSYAVNSNGVLTFSSGTLPNPSIATGTLPNATIPAKSVCLWGLGIGATGDYIVAKTFGTAPNRQLWVQWNSATELNMGTNAWCYMSIVLEETTNKIFIVDQRASANGTTKIAAGIQIDGTTAVKLNNSNAYAASNDNNPEPSDNKFFTFVPGTAPAIDAAAVSFENKNVAILNQAPYTLSYKVGNNGTDAITSLKISYTVGSGSAVTDVISGLNIASGAIATVNSTTKWNPGAVGVYTIVAKIDEVNGGADVLSNNNFATKTISVASEIVTRNVLHEQFTSSTCPPCTPGNINVNGILNGKSNYTIAKHQMNYPGTGDPYFNAENSTRHNYYGVTGIPNMVVDGKFWQGNSNSYTAALLTSAQAEPAFIALTGSARNTWKNKITVDVTISPKANFSSSNLKLFALIVEKSTYANVKTNGEMEFDHVVKKIMPSASGEPLTALVSGTNVSKSLSYTFNGNYVLPASGAAPANLATQNTIENFGNLAVVVFVQDATTKEVFQSAIFDVSNNSTEDLSTKMNVFPNPASNQTLVNVDALNNVTSTVQLINVTGQVVATGTTTNGQHTFDVSALADGIYTVKMTANNVQAIKKIVVRH